MNSYQTTYANFTQRFPDKKHCYSLSAGWSNSYLLDQYLIAFSFFLSHVLLDSHYGFPFLPEISPPWRERMLHCSWWCFLLTYH